MLVGRDVEIDKVADLIRRAGTSSSCVLISGEPGIGKTSLLVTALEQTAGDQRRVLSARPTRAEAPLPFAALTDLLHDVSLETLATPQRGVLEIALGRRDSEGRPPLANQLGMAFVGVIESLVVDGPLLITVDDVQWVDAATRELLEFAVRRLPAAGVCVIVTQRTSPTDRSQPAFADVPDGQVIVLRPLAAEATEAVVRAALPAPLPGHVVDRVIAVASGNPLYAIEFARATSDAVMHPGRPLPVPESLGAVMAARFHALPARTSEALAALALLARPSIDVLTDLGLVDDLRPAEQAGIVQVQTRRVSFTHPVLASAAYDAVTGTQRLELHRRLAEVTSGTERCIHLGLGSTHPDATIAAELACAAELEVDRGAPLEAAEIGVLALDATPADDPERWARVVSVAALLFHAGRTEEAVEQVRAAHEHSSDDVVRARAMLTWATIEFSRSADPEVAARLVRECLTMTTDPDLLAEAHSILARSEYKNFEVAASHAASALNIVRSRPDPDPALLAVALTASAAAGFNAGHGLDRAGLEQAIELEAGTNVLVSDSAYATLAALLKYADALDESQAMFEELARQADPGSLPYALGHLPQIHLWAGRWDEAERCAHMHLDIAEQTHQESQIETARFNLAVIAAHRGDAAHLVEPAARALFDEGHAEDVPWTERIGAALLGFVAMTTGDAVSAVKYFGRYDELGEMMQLHEPGLGRFHGDFVEALVATGDIARATEVIERVGRRAARLNRPSALAAVDRGRALVAAHAGEREPAFAAARAAIETLEHTPLAYDKARAQLTLGTVARRFRERAVAREALERALARFEEMGAVSLSERARRERDRVSGRAPAQRTGVAALTATETSVAELAAGGLTTRQIAESMFISVKTVEANLTRVYRKLGLTNRAQLANHVALARDSSRRSS